MPPLAPTLALLLAGTDLPTEQVVLDSTPAPQGVGPVPAVVYLATEGITLTPCTGAHGARRCTELIPDTAVFPAWGTPQERSALLQAVEDYYAAVDLRVTDEAPPDYLPYMLAVVGGHSSLIGKRETSCGLAWLSCGGGRRNLLSLTFASSCGGSESPEDVASVLAHETAHNLGLEHTNQTSDLMFPTVTASDQAFTDECLTILTADDRDEPLCPDVHARTCPELEGAEQNDVAELLEALGPRRADTSPPSIERTVPADGDVLDPDQTVQIYAELADDSGWVGVRWTLVDAPPAHAEQVGETRCTNDMCDTGYPAFHPADGTWPFMEIREPAAGTYLLRLEVADYAGHTLETQIQFQVSGEDSTGGPDDTTGTGDGSGTSGAETAGTGPGSESDGPQTPPPSGDDGCACEAASGAHAKGSGMWLFVLGCVLSCPTRRRTTDRP